MNTDEKILAALETADSIMFDGCHKIYINADREQTKQSEGFHYMRLVTETSREVCLAAIRAWWEESCGLRFISLVETNDEDPNLGFTPIIEQFEEWE